MLVRVVLLGLGSVEGDVDLLFVDWEVLFWRVFVGGEIDEFIGGLWMGIVSEFFFFFRSFCDVIECFELVIENGFFDLVGLLLDFCFIEFNILVWFLNFMKF